MVLSRQFVSATIEQKEKYVVLTINYSWYWISSFSETFIVDSIEEAKTKLLRERSNERVSVIVGGQESNQKIFQ